jgi:hypothetical protein
MEIYPDEYKEYLESFDENNGPNLNVYYPMRFALVRSLVKKDTPKEFNHINYVSGVRGDFSRNLHDGDSGQPGFIIINDKPILIFTNFLTDNSPSLGDYMNEINYGIELLGNSGGYRITEFKNTGFKTYSSFCNGPVIPTPSQFKATTNTSCISKSDQLKVNLFWSDPLNYSRLSNTYQYRLYKENQLLDLLSMNTYNYTDLNVKPDTVNNYSLKLYYGQYYSIESSTQIKTPSICTAPIINNPVPLTTTLPSTPETKPVINNDQDKDGILDSADVCSNTGIDQKSAVNLKGCVKPKITKFQYPSSVIESDLNEVNNFELSNSYGKILFTSPVSLTRATQQLDIDANVYIGQNVISLNSSNLPELNRGAIITLNNISFRNPVIYKDDIICSTCEIVSYTNNTFRFKVKGFSNYSVIEGYVEPAKQPVLQNTNTEPITQPVIQVNVQPINKPIIQPVVQPVTQPVIIEPVIEPITQPKLQTNSISETYSDMDGDIINSEYSPEDINIKYEKPNYYTIVIEIVKNTANNIISRISSGFKRIFH